MLSFSTFKDNSSPAGSTFRLTGGAPGTINLINSVLQSVLANNCNGTDPNDLGFNWATDTTCGLNANSFEQPNPGLLALASNGGCVDTCLPDPTSPLIKYNSSTSGGCGR